MVQGEVLLKRMKQLDEYLSFLRSLQAYDLKEFLANPERWGSAERFLQLAIECLTDIGNHIVAYQELGSVDVYRDIPDLLHEAEHIDRDLREIWVGMIGFRNILVHGYLDVDREIVYQMLNEQLTDFERFKVAFAKFL